MDSSSRRRNFRKTQAASNQSIDKSKTSGYKILIDRRSRRLTSCVLCLVAALASLTPSILSLHLTHKLGLFIFETDRIELRSSLITVIICLIFLVIFYLTIFAITRGKRSEMRSRIIQNISKYLMGLLATISAISYLSLALLIEPIRQVQRMPTATFDCNANLITIENCHQQYSTFNHERFGDNIVKATRELLIGDLNQVDDKLIKRLNCIHLGDRDQYRFRDSDQAKIPTRFLLHHCGLVCKPHKQQLHQFSDDLNQGQVNPEDPLPKKKEDLESSTKTASRLFPPYISVIRSEEDDRSDRGLHGKLNDYHSGLRQTRDTLAEHRQSNQVSLKVCFSDEFNSGSAYKQFCVTNLANGPSRDRSLTLNQLNALLKRYVHFDDQATVSTENEGDSESNRDRTQLDLNSSYLKNSPIADPKQDLMDLHTTNYMNPFVQFESNFRGWSTLGMNESSLGSTNSDQEENWCKLKPVPPFIVNNRPFSDIQCSVEHQYTVTTTPVSMAFQRSSQDKIFLQRHSRGSQESQESSRERCNIQCKVNILYQIHRDKTDQKINRNLVYERPRESRKSLVNDIHYYLPLRPCLIVHDVALKQRSTQKYLALRTIGDSSLMIAFILLDLILLMESIDTRKAIFEGKKYRLIGMFLAFSLVPLATSLTFDLIASTTIQVDSVQTSQDLKDRNIPTIIELIRSLASKYISPSVTDSKNQPDLRLNSTKPMNEGSLQPSMNAQFDRFMAPFFIYTLSMILFALNSFSIPVLTSLDPLIRVSSFEELGMAANSKKSERLSKLNNVRSKDHSRHMIRNATSQAQKVELYNEMRPQMSSKWIYLTIVTILMGFLFNLIQLSQVEILGEIFGTDFTTQPGHSDPRIFPFTFSVYLSSAIPLLIASVIFSEELSSLLSSFQSFNTTVSASLDYGNSSRIKTRFIKYFGISLVIYSIRLYMLANMGSGVSYMKKFMAFLFQIAEVFNFPITWFAISTYAHEFQIERESLNHDRQSTRDVRGNTNRSLKQFQRAQPETRETELGALVKRLLIQTSLGMLYFVVSRAVALLAHSIYVSLHLHSEDFDWFITSFYKQSDQQKPGAKPPRLSNGQTTRLTAEDRPESLFSPLPTDRQTYLHASRLFLRFTSLVCLCLGVIVSANYGLLRYRMWRQDHQSRRKSSDRSQAQSTSGDNIDERLSLDLMRIHASPTRMIHPRTSKQISGSLDGKSSPEVNKFDHEQEQDEPPRARVLFHYETMRPEESDSSSPVEADDSLRSSPPETNEQNRGPEKPDEIRIPMENPSESGSESIESEHIERVSRHVRSRRVKLYDDEECWSTTELNDEPDLKPPNQWDPNRRKRSISFAPAAIFIADSSDGKESTRDSQDRADIYSGRVARASPEPSIGCESDESLDR